MLGLGKKTNVQPQGTPAVSGQPPPSGAPVQAAGSKTPAVTPARSSSQTSKAYTALQQGSVSVIDLVSPSSVEIDFRNSRVGNKFFRTFFVVDYPRSIIRKP
jgi:hypothetical protein